MSLRLLARGTPAFVPALWLLPLLALSRRRPLLALAWSGVCLPVTWFFRDPDRSAAGRGVLAAADGRVQLVGRDPDGRWRVSTYLSLRDVHVTRAPIDAHVVSQSYRAGSHRMAFRPESHTNERLEWTLATAYGQAGLTQYAGTLARRIVAQVGPGERVDRGARVGLIRFGSRVDVVLPAGADPLVAVGDRVKGGHTVIAELPETVVTQLDPDHNVAGASTPAG